METLIKVALGLSIVTSVIWLIMVIASLFKKPADIVIKGQIITRTITEDGLNGRVVDVTPVAVNIEEMRRVKQGENVGSH